MPDAFSAREIARAAGATPAEARALVAAGLVQSIDGRFVDTTEAVRAVRLLQGRTAGPPAKAPLFANLRAPVNQSSRRHGLPLTLSGVLHAGALAVALFATFGAASERAELPASVPTRLVFVVSPGPGGGGGGGGLRQPEPARPAKLERKQALRSPVPRERSIRRPDPPPPRRPDPPPPEVRPAPKPVEPPPPIAKPDPVPPVVAPVASASADAHDRTGDLTDRSSDSQGSGNGGGAGTGGGTGMGAGTGPGIGDGSGGGTGGGPYRPGSGIEPPELVREVKPDYTEEARRRNLTGDVVLEIVVRSDGRVGAVKIARGLGAGLDERAVDAVRQWRFTPARRHGAPVDVVVEVAVEFRLR